MGSSPDWAYGYVPTPAQWNLAFSEKQDDLGLSLQTIETLQAGNIAVTPPVLLGITRADIPSNNLAAYGRFLTTDGAPWIHGSPFGPMAIQDSGGQWWQIDLSTGYGHAKWFGAVGDGSTDDTVALNAALTALGNAGGGRLDVTGYRYLVNTGNLTVPNGVSIRGPYENFGLSLVAGTANYSSVKSAIILNPTYTIYLGVGSGMSGFLLISSQITAPTTLRQALDLIKNSFNGTSITVGDSGATGDVGADAYIGHMTIIGFNLGIWSHNQSRFTFEHNHIDCLSGIYVSHCGDLGRIQHNHIWNFATAQVTGGYTTYTVTGAANNGSGLIRLTTSTNVLAAGDTIVVTSVGGTTEANGRWVVAAATATTVDLTGSAFVNAYTSGGQAVVSAFKRAGNGIQVANTADYVTVFENFSFAHDCAFRIDNADLVNLIANSCDCESSEQDPTTIGIYFVNGSKWGRVIGNSLRAHGYNIKMDPATGASGTGENADIQCTYIIEGNDIQYGNQANIYLLTGRAQILNNVLAHRVTNEILVDGASYGIVAIGNSSDVSATPILFQNAGSALSMSTIRCNRWTDTSSVSEREVYDNRTRTLNYASYGSASGIQPTYSNARGTAAAPTATQSGDKLFHIVGQSYDGANFVAAAQIRATSDGTPSSGTSSPGSLVFSVTASGSQTLTDVMTIENAGNVIPSSNNAVGLGRPSHAWQNVAAGFYYIGTGATPPTITAGTGAPSASAPQGSLYIRLDGSSTSTRLYVNTNGSTTWTNVVTAA